MFPALKLPFSIKKSGKNKNSQQSSQNKQATHSALFLKEGATPLKG